MNDQTDANIATEDTASPLTRLESVTVTLSVPIIAYGETVSELTFRRPVGKDQIEIGNPVIFDPMFDPPRMTHDAKIMAAMMRRLVKGNIPITSFEQMDCNDMTNCWWALTRFFTPMRAANTG